MQAGFKAASLFYLPSFKLKQSEIVPPVAGNSHLL
jgi:hypothetical protein